MNKLKTLTVKATGIRWETRYTDLPKEVELTFKQTEEYDPTEYWCDEPFQLSGFEKMYMDVVNEIQQMYLAQYVWDIDNIEVISIEY